MLRKACAAVPACLFVMFVSGVAHAQGQPSPQEMMATAHRLAEEGKEYILNLSGGEQGGVYVFYNNPRPFCYTYVIPGGGWVKAQAESAWHSQDRKRFAGVVFRRSQELKDFDGETLVQRAGSAIGRSYEKDLGQPLTGMKLAPFESVLQGTRKWTADPATRGDRRIVFPTKIIADFSPDGIAIVTIGGTADDDGLARRVLSSLKTTKNPECYFSALESGLKALNETKPPDASVRVGGVIEAPKRLKSVSPVYPEAARQARVSGTVVLDAFISSEGSVTKVIVLRGVPLLEEAAAEAVKQWVYAPTLVKGKPVPVIMPVTVNFTLRDQATASEVAAPEASASATYFNPTARWSVSYPTDWRVDDNNRAFVKIIKAGAIVGIFTGTGVAGKTLDEVADARLQAWEQRIGNVFLTVSRRPLTLSDDLPAIEVVHRIGTGVIGKSRKVIAVVEDRAFWIDEETNLDSWPAFERDFNRIIESFKVQK
jgi:TonB family protein